MAVRALTGRVKGGPRGQDFPAPPTPMATKGRGEDVEKGPYLNLKVSPSSTALPGVISKIPLKG